MPAKNNFPSVMMLILLLTVGVYTLPAQEKPSLSISEIHTLSESMVNYLPDSTLTLLDLAAKKIEKLEDRDEAASYWATNNLRRADYWLFDDTDLAKEHLRKAHDYYIKHVDNKKLAEVFCLKAQLIKKEGQMQLDAIQAAIPYFEKALSYALQQDNPRTTSFIYYENAITLQQTERWHESLENALQAIHYSELSGDSLSMAMAYFLMGRTYNYFGFLDYSEEYMAKAVNYGTGMDLLFVIIHNYAKILHDNQKTDLAIQNYALALKMCLEREMLDRAIDIYTSIGLLQFGEKNYEKAEEAYSAISILSETVEADHPITFLFKAKMNHYWGNTTQTLAYLKSFENESANAITTDIDGYKSAADLYMSLGLPTQSALFYKQWGTLKDSLQAYTNRVQLNELEMLYFNERSKNEEITLKNKELKESRSYQANMGMALIAFLLIGGSFTYYIRIKGLRENQKLKDTMKSKQLKQLMEVQESERQRIARELHDGIGQSLAALKLQLQFDDTPDAPQVTVDRVDALCKEVRTLSHQMMPLVLRENGLKSAMKQLLKHSFTNPEIDAEIVSHNIDIRLPEKMEIHLYRITQELISNILKHANATNVGVQLLLRGDMLILIVEDNGKGFIQDNKSEGLGISNVYSRVEALSGTMKIRSSKQNGTCFHIAIPVPPQTIKKIA